MKRIPAATLLLLAAAGATAEVLTPAQALSRVNQTASAAAHAPALNQQTPQPVLTVSDDAEQPAIYVFDHMVVSAESEATPLLGYYDEPLTADALPDGLQYMLDCYNREIASLRSGEYSASQHRTYQRPERDEISPVCKTKWGQETPFNNLCPRLNGETTVTGCVATAVAQVLSTYKYPEKCSGGTFSYSWTAANETLSLDFDEVELNWAKMPASVFVNATQRTAVATLMRAIGYASRMQYGLSSGNGSGAQSQYMLEGLVRNFGFAKSAMLQRRAWYSYPEWEQMVYDELSRGYGVYYEGVTAAQGGHAFVIDGYQNDGYFHLNWGWDGSANGYFLLTALAPLEQGVGGSTGGYDFGQGVLVGLTPANENPMDEAPLNMMCNSFAVSGNTSVKLGSKVTFSGGFYNYGSETVTAMEPGVRLVNVADTAQSITLLSGGTASSCAIYAGFASFSVTLPSALDAGTYRVIPVVKSPATGIVYDMRLDATIGALRATVSSSTVSFRSTLPVVAFSDWSIPSLVTGRAFTLSATATNTNSLHYQGGIRGFIAKRNSAGNYEAIEQYTRVLLDLEADESATFTYSDALSVSVTPGSGYYFGFANDRGATIGSLQPVTVVEYQSGILQIEADTEAEAVNAPVYDLTGRRLSSVPTEGFYIQNGKINRK